MLNVDGSVFNGYLAELVANPAEISASGDVVAKQMVQ